MQQGSHLQMAVDWQSLFESGKELIDAGDYAAAVPVLKEALAKIESLDEVQEKVDDTRPDKRIGQTLERLAFAYHKQGNLADAEPLYRKALEIVSKYMIALLDKEAAAHNLADLLIETGRDAEAESLLARYPKRDRKPVVYRASNEMGVITSLSLLARQGSSYTREFLSLMEMLVRNVETHFGSASKEFADVSEKLGTAYMQTGSTKGKEFLEKSLLAKLSLPDAANEVSSLSQDIQMCDPLNPLGRALLAKYGVDSLTAITESAIAKSLKMLGVERESEPQTSMSIEEAEKVIADWKSKQPAPSQPDNFSDEEHLRSLLPILEKATVLVKEVEIDAQYPLSTISMLSQCSKVYEELGDIPKAIEAREEEWQISSAQWGESHVMTVEIYTELEKLKKRN